MTTVTQPSIRKSRAAPKSAEPAPSSRPVLRQAEAGSSIPAKPFTAAIKRIEATTRETDDIIKQAMTLIG